MPPARAYAVRSRVEPRGVPPGKAARRLGITEPNFLELLPRLLARGFPAADPDTGMYDLVKIDRWMDGLEGSTSSGQARDPREVVNDRLARL